MKYCLILICLFCIKNSQAEFVFHNDFKKWDFPFANDKITITISERSNDRDGQMDYALQIITHGKYPYAADEAEFLKSVLQDMEKSDMPPKRIYLIDLMIFEPDVIKKLATAAYNTTIWNKLHKTQPGEAVVQLLRLTNAYAPFNLVLKPYGIEQTVVHAEKICTIKPEDIGLKKRKIILPSCATLEIYVHPISP